MDNLQSIIADGELISDTAMIARGGPPSGIGMSDIKRRRLSLPITCHQGDMVGDYVPFFFCPRSVMLYVIHCANHKSLTYLGGQEPIVHLESDLESTIAWARTNGKRWAFSSSNAGSYYAQFWANVNDLNQIDWTAVANPDFRNAQVKEAKQAEFLFKDSFPWELVEHIGVCSSRHKLQVKQVIGSSAHKPVVSVQKSWYF